MAVLMQEVEVWVLIDSNGDYVASDDADLLNERYEERVQEVSAAEGTRRIKITLKVPLPAVIELTGTVATVEEPGELTAA